MGLHKIFTLSLSVFLATIFIEIKVFFQNLKNVACKLRMQC